jgi:hypothetical protein
VTSNTYLLPNAWHQARERLALLERVLDPGTTRHLDELGVAAGWECLEFGAGGGSIAAWLCARVGSTGRVVATDLDTRFLEALECHRYFELYLAASRIGAALVPLNHRLAGRELIHVVAEQRSRRSASR